MVQVTIGNATSRKKILVPSNKKISEILEENDINYGSSRVTCNGETLNASAFGKELREVIGDADSCYLMAVVKIDNGNK
jgi:hypothetical protein